MEWMLKAAERQQEIAAPFLVQLYTMLAKNYVAGTGAAKDMSAAVKWYARAAALNDPDAMAQLGYYYQTGIGGTKDEKHRRLYVACRSSRFLHGSIQCWRELLQWPRRSN